MEFYPTTDAKQPFEGDILVLPVVSTGNVAQLAVDLLISTFGLTRIGVFSSGYFVPAVGGREDGQAGITLPLELYGKAGTNVKVIQQRSPALKTHKGEVINALLSFIESSKFSVVLVLSSIDLSDRPDSHMSAPTFHLIPTATPTNTSSTSPQLHSALHALQTHIPPFLTREPTANQTSLDTIPALPGSGLTRRFITSLPPTFSPAVGVILEYVLEGDNRADAQILAGSVAKVLRKELGVSGDEQWKEPTSWKNGLFGSAHDQTLYG